MKIRLEGSFGVRARPMAPSGPGRYGAKPLDTRDTWTAFALLVALGLPFTFAGLWGLSQAPGLWLEHDTTGALVHFAAGLAFAVVGIGLIAGTWWARGRVLRDAALAYAHPDEPWKWRTDWAEGYAQDQAPKGAWALGAFALLWNLIALPAGIFALRAGPYAWVALLFPAAGVALAAKAFGIWRRSRAQGVSKFRLDVVPVPLGRTLSGTVQTRLATPPDGGFALTLSALRTMRSSHDDDVTTRIVWQEEAQAPGQVASDMDGLHVVVPVAIRLPVEAPSTDHADSSDELEWKLTVRAPGYEATFDVPVYRTADSGTPETASDAPHLRLVTHGDPIPTSYAAPPLSEDAPRPEPRSSIEVTRDAEGLVVDFPPGRNPGPARGFTGFALLWTGAIVFMTRFHAPVFFPIVFALFDILLIWLALRLWFGTARVRANAAGVKVARGLGQPGAERFVAARDVADVRLSIGMSSGDQAWYDLALYLKDGRKVALGETLRSKREAEWIAGQIQAALQRDA